MYYLCYVLQLDEEYNIIKKQNVMLYSWLTK